MNIHLYQQDQQEHIIAQSLENALNGTIYSHNNSIDRNPSRIIETRNIEL